MMIMVTSEPRSPRRRQILTPERIIATAIGILDSYGLDGLTVRSLAERLSTGSGAIYHHVGSREELLDRATETLLYSSLSLEAEVEGHTAEERIRSVALNLFDAVDAHEWLATLLTVQVIRKPWGLVTTGIFERFGQQVRALGVPEESWFTTTSTLVHYLLGAISQKARTHGEKNVYRGDDRTRFLESTSTRWHDLDQNKYPFVRAIADQMRTHDDREQFEIGINIVLDGVRYGTHSVLNGEVTRNEADHNG